MSTSFIINGSKDGKKPSTPEKIRIVVFQSLPPNVEMNGTLMQNVARMEEIKIT
jgi:hypothetical protein